MRTMDLRANVVAAIGIAMMVAILSVVYRYTTERAVVAKQANCGDMANEVSKNLMPNLPRPGVVCSRERIANADLDRSEPVFVGEDEQNALSERIGDDEKENAQLASDKNQIMDAFLDQPNIPADYADVMIGLYRDKTQDVVTRDFAVQHIGHYALALNRRGQYDADSAEAKSLRDALFEAAGETRTIVAVAAFRALADMAEFDNRIDTSRFDSMLSACAVDADAELPVRVMAVQICGERRVTSSRQSLAAIVAAPDSPEVLRRSAKFSLSQLE